MLSVFGDTYKGVGNLDYVAAWYKKAADIMDGNREIRTAYVSTNSITQGEQPALLWRPLMAHGVSINFGVPTFKWSNEGRGIAAVHCVIVGFSFKKTEPNINPYLLKGPTVFIERRTEPLCDIPEMNFGSMPNDGGNLIIEESEFKDFIKAEPSARSYIRQFMMGVEFINGIKRYCLWLEGVSPAELRKMPLVMKRVEACRKHRANSKRGSTKKLASRATLFGEIRQPNTRYLALPEVSSEKRDYIPIAFLPKDVIAGNKLFTIPGANLYHLGILTSIVHMAWMRAVCGRLKSDYSYSNTIVYNNFPWPDATDKDKAKISELAQDILDARVMFPDCSLADLYDPAATPPELLKAHQALDKAVMKLYGYKANATEAEVVADLMQRHKALAEKCDTK